MEKYSYENISALCTKYKCILNESDKYFDQINKPDRFSIRSACGHTTMSTLNNFVKHKIGVYCIDCMKTIDGKNLICMNSVCNLSFIGSQKSFLFCSKRCTHSRKQTEETKNKITTTLNKHKHKYEQKTFILHNSGNEFIINLFSNEFIFIVSSRRSKCNMLYKPKEITKDQWLPIQIKYSDTKNNDNYYFSLKSKSEDVPMLFVHMKEKKYWLFPPHTFKQFSFTCSSLRIKFNDKDNKYLVDESNLLLEFRSLYITNNDKYICEYDTYITEPNNYDIHALIEHEYILLRINSIHFLKFDRPHSNFLTYNFIVNSKTVQETVGFMNKYNSTIASLHKESKGKCYPYEMNDADFYWINEPDKDTFYVINQYILDDKGYLKTITDKGKLTMNITKNEEWLCDYRFKYSTINDPLEQNKLIDIFH
jgi:hypothetical protein